jgi:hypothetical protein
MSDWLSSEVRKFTEYVINIIYKNINTYDMAIGAFIYSTQNGKKTFKLIWKICVNGNIGVE